MWVLYNINTATEFKITKAEYVGRNKEVLISTQDQSVSRLHAQLTFSPTNLLQVQDLKSSNGTYVNNERINPMNVVLLNVGDVIAFGNVNPNVRALTPLIFKVMQKSEPMENIIDLCSDDEPIIENNNDNYKSPGGASSVITENVVNGNPDELMPIDNKIKIEIVEEEKFDPSFLSINKTEDTKNLEESIKTEIKKEEFEERNNSSEFRITSDFIVISDDENDGDLLCCSQIFKLDQQIKKELEECPDQDNHDILTIKQELEYMDEIQEEEVVVNKVPINVEQEFKNTQDLRDLLEYQPQSQINTYNEVLKKQVGNTVEKNHDDQKKKSKKYIKPPIIEPHHMSKKTKDDKTREKHKSPPKSDKKRRTSLSEVSKSKKLKSDKESSKKTEDSKEHKPKGDDVKALKDERKRKLKELPKKESINTKSSKITTTIKPKTPPTSIDPLKLPIPKKNSTLVKDKIKTVNVPKKPPILSKSIIAPNVKASENSSLTHSNTNQKARTSGVVVKTQIKTVERCASLKIEPIAGPSSTISLKIPKQMNGISVNPYSTEDSVTPEELYFNPIHKFVPNRPIVEYDSISVEEIYNKITNWKANWFVEQKNCSHSPPINGDRELKLLPKYFESYDDYYSTITSLVYLELWHQLYDSLYKNNESSCIVAQILHTKIIRDLVYFQCVCYVDEETSKKGPVIRQSDCGLLEIKFNNRNGDNLKFTGLTVVTECCNDVLKPDSKIKDLAASCIKNLPHTEYKFQLVMKHLPDSEKINSLVVIKLFTNIGVYKRLIKTIKYLKHNKKLCNLIIKPNPDDYFVKQRKLDVNGLDPMLNEKQKQVVKEACEVATGSHYGFYLIKGPPGTGKSTVILNIISQLLLKLDYPYSILLTAPSNAAIDALVKKILDHRATFPEPIKKKIKLVRIGPVNSISKHVQKMKLSTLTAQFMVNRLPQPQQYRDAASRGVSEETFLKQYFGPSYHYERSQAENTVINSANIIATTLNSCIHFKITNAIRKGDKKFMCCIVDEATQAHELETLQPIVLGIERFILVGDPQQLPATVCNRDAKNLGFDKSLFTRIAENFESIPYVSNPIRMLEEQYRMDPKICHFPNKYFYNNRLKSCPIKQNRITPALQPYLVFNLRDTTYTSDNYYNQIEVEFIHNLLDLICKRIDVRCSFSIGVITPYTAQKEAIDRKLKGIESLKKANITYTVNTVDSFQGREEDIIVISCVRESPNIFLKNENRLNVALTRAKQALYIIGNYNLFKHTTVLYDLREDAKQRQLCIDIQNISQEFFDYLKKYIFIR